MDMVPSRNFQDNKAPFTHIKIILPLLYNPHKRGFSHVWAIATNAVAMSVQGKNSCIVPVVVGGFFALCSFLEGIMPFLF